MSWLQLIVAAAVGGLIGGVATAIYLSWEFFKGMQ